MKRVHPLLAVLALLGFGFLDGIVFAGMLSPWWYVGVAVGSGCGGWFAAYVRGLQERSGDA